MALPFMKNRFQGFLPIVIDVETGGFNAKTDALLEIAAVFVDFNAEGLLVPIETYCNHVEAFEGANIEPEALEVNRIDPDYPLRFAKSESYVLNEFFNLVRKKLHQGQCRRAILVGHNAHFDLSFLQQAIERCKITNNPFHAFTCFDTATLSAVMYGKTVLARALKEAGIEFNKEEAHSAVYDAEKTAELFCKIVNATQR